MNPEIQKRVFKLTTGKILLISLLSIILIALAVAGQVTYTLLKYDRVYNGVHINELDAGGLSSTELESLLTKIFQDKVKESELVLKCKDISEKISYIDIGLSYNISGAVKNAFDVGRTGNIFERLYDIAMTARNGKSQAVQVQFDRSKVDAIIETLYNKTLINVKEADLLIQENKVTIRSGHHGENIDKSATFSEVDKSLKAHKSGTLDIPFTKTAPGRIDTEEYYKKINLEAADAAVKVENNNVTVTPHTVGRIIDKPALTSIAAELEKSEDTEKILPVSFIKPKVTTEDVYAKLFKDTLGAMNTQFYTGNTNDSNRGENIRIAVDKINGKILAPGEVFSFNDIVGPRTEDGGYKVAHTYVGGKVVDGIGGGICQVSTTLYNAVLFSDLDVVERTNHMFTVGYVPFGRDAAVSYDQVDLKFRNSTKWPVKIIAEVTKANKIFFTIKGTNEFPGKTIEIVPKIIKTMDFTVKDVNDPALNEGVVDVKNEGMKGYVVDTYKIVKNDGKVVSETKIHTSTYKPLDKEVHHGTKKPQAAAPQTTQAKPGVDEAANPPAKPGQ